MTWRLFVAIVVVCVACFVIVVGFDVWVCRLTFLLLFACFRFCLQVVCLQMVFGGFTLFVLFGFGFWFITVVLLISCGFDGVYCYYCGRVAWVVCFVG